MSYLEGVTDYYGATGAADHGNRRFRHGPQEIQTALPAE